MHSVQQPVAVRRPIVVQKFGGSSVADIEKIGKVADKVVATRRAGADVVVVVSAMGKTTDSLLTMARDAARSPELGCSQPEGEPPRRELDMLLSTGERVSMALLSIAIQARGCEAISFTGSQSGILTNDRHFDARIIEVRPHRIEDELARGKVVIVAGYQGMSYRREITTLGRGGSDTTAVALAAALEAERCEIYSDVDGVYSADPRVVPDARHLPELDLSVLQEMAEAGAKVVCAQAVEWARRAKIAIHARATFDRSVGARETIARENGERGRQMHAVRAIVAERSVALVRLSSIAALDAFARCASDAAVSYRDMHATSAGATAVVPLMNVPDLSSIRARLVHVSSDARIDTGFASVSVVGDGLGGGGEPLAAFLSALRQAEAYPAHVVAGPLRLAATIEAERVDVAQRALHAAFVAMA